MALKKAFFQKMHKATMEHARWLAEVKKLTSGHVDDPRKYKRSFLETDFYRWFQDAASHLLFEEGFEELKQVEKLMYHLDGEYTSLYNVAIGNRAKNMFGKYKPLSAKEYTALEKYYRAMLIVTEKIEQALTNLEPKIKRLPDEFFAFMEKQDEAPNPPEQTPAPQTSKRHSGGARGAVYEDDE